MSHTILYKSINLDIDKLLELIKVDRAKARVLIKNDTNKYQYHEVILFEKDNSKDFSVISQNKQIRISSNNKLYSVQKHKTGYIYKENKFWCIEGNTRVRPLCLFYFLNKGPLENNRELNVFRSKFSWINFLIEFKDKFQSLPFNSIIKYKLYSYADCMRYLYKTNLPTAKIYNEAKILPSELKSYKRILVNLENPNSEILLLKNRDLFIDSIKLADTLNKKVNCSWGLKRLTQEHDQWAKEITNIVMETSNRDLNIDPIFKEFAQQTNYNLLQTTKDLALEGLKQSHCVASYSQQVDSGNCAIFHVDGYTLKVNKSYINNKYLQLGQILGLRNCQAPLELRNEVTTKITEFNSLQDALHYSQEYLQLF